MSITSLFVYRVALSRTSLLELLLKYSLSRVRVALSRTSLLELLLKYSLSRVKKLSIISVNLFFGKCTSLGWTLLRALMKFSKIARILYV
jgi:hypothetical protein